MQEFNVIVAYDKNRGIGKDNKLPWDIKTDIKWFKEITTRTIYPTLINVVIMGKNTWHSLPFKSRPLEKRINIIVSSTLELTDEIQKNKIIISKTFDDALAKAYEISNLDKIFVIGGEQLYKTAILHKNLGKIYAAEIDGDYDCDKFFPSIYDYKFKTIYTNSEFDLIKNENVQVKMVKYSKIEKSNSGIGIWLPNVQALSGEYQYLNVLSYLLSSGESRQTRNSRTLSTFGSNMVFDLNNGFPLLTTKRVFFRGVFEELKFFLQGKTDTNILTQKGIKIWEPNTSKEFLEKCNLDYQPGDMGNMYGLQLRAFGCDYKGCNNNYLGQGIDQIKNSLDLLKKDPASRRNILTTFNPSNVHQGVLYPCHGISIQFYLSKDNGLSCCMTQRSADIICGVPFNIASYALLVHIYCAILNTENPSQKYYPDRLTLNFGDLHMYEVSDHIECAKLQLSREPYKFPELEIIKQITLNTIDDLEFSDIILKNYQAHPAIKVNMVA